MKNYKLTLTEFLDSNHKLFSVLGIFTALTVFSSNMKPVQLGIVLSFLFMSATILVWFVIMNKIPEQKTLPMEAFSYILLFILFGVVAYWFIGYKSVWKDHARTILLLPTTIIFTLASVHFERKCGPGSIVHKIRTRGETVTYLLLGVPVIILAFVVSDFLAMLIETKLLE